MRFALADPPYFGRGERWYGAGRGHGGGHGRADFHADAGRWDEPEAHRKLVAYLDAEFDGWAVALSPDSLSLYLAAAPADVRVAVWVKGNAIPSGSRVRSMWEPVVVRVPAARRSYAAGVAVDDVLVAGIEHGGFAGRKPRAWTHWALSMLGYDPAVDEVVDMFPGSGAVSQAIADFRVAGAGKRARVVPTEQRQQLRRGARVARGRKAAVLAALRAGGSVRAVAADAGVSTNTVQRWKKDLTVTGTSGTT